MIKITRFVKFCGVGFINTAHHYVWYILLSTVISYELANIVAFLAAMIGSFYLNNYITFKVRPTLRAFFLFPSVYIPQLVLSYFVPYICIKYFEINVYWIPAITTIAVLPITFLCMRRVLREKK